MKFFLTAVPHFAFTHQPKPGSAPSNYEQNTWIWPYKKLIFKQ